MLCSQSKLPASFNKKLNGERNYFRSLIYVYQLLVRNITNVLRNDNGTNNLQTKVMLKLIYLTEKFRILTIVLRKKKI